MCGRYYIDQEDTLSEMRQIIDAINQRYRDSAALESMKTGEIAPGHIVPAIRLRQMESGLSPVPELVRWGFQKPQSKSLLINARGETATEKATFKTPFKKARVLIPAHAFFEWKSEQGTRQKQKIKFFNPDEAVFYMAGIARQENDHNTDDPSAPLMRFVIITVQANDSVRLVHDRMPLIVPRSSLRSYLEDEHEAKRLLAHPVETILSSEPDKR